MAKKSLKKAKKQLAPEAKARQSDSAYPAETHELNEQRRRVKNAAAAGAEALKASAPGVPPAGPPSPAAVSSPPLGRQAALRPTPVPAQAASKPAQTPARQAQTRPVPVAAPQASLAPAAPAVELPVEWEPKQLSTKAAVAEAPKPPMPPKVKITFVVVDLGAKQVSLSGEFNGWSPNATLMNRHPDGHWETTVDLAPGRYQYKFIVDGQWIPDPQAPENVWNQHGTLNSVVEVRA